jgi:hypothetical protein
MPAADGLVGVLNLTDMDKRTYKGVSRADMEKVRGELGKFGISLPPGDDVEVKGPLGVKMQVTYSEAAKTLELEITKKPVFVSDTQIWKVVEMGAGKFVNGRNE